MKTIILLMVTASSLHAQTQVGQALRQAEERRRAGAMAIHRQVQADAAEAERRRQAEDAEKAAKESARARHRASVIRDGHAVRGTIYPFVAIENLGCVWSEQRRQWFAPTTAIRDQAQALMSSADGSAARATSPTANQVITVRQSPDGTRVTNVFQVR